MRAIITSTILPFVALISSIVFSAAISPPQSSNEQLIISPNDASADATLTAVPTAAYTIPPSSERTNDDCPFIPPLQGGKDDVPPYLLPPDASEDVIMYVGNEYALSMSDGHMAGMESILGTTEGEVFSVDDALEDLPRDASKELQEYVSKAYYAGFAVGYHRGWKEAKATLAEDVKAADADCMFDVDADIEDPIPICRIVPEYDWNIPKHSELEWRWVDENANSHKVFFPDEQEYPFWLDDVGIKRKVRWEDEGGLHLVSVEDDVDADGLTFDDKGGFVYDAHLYMNNDHDGDAVAEMIEYWTYRHKPYVGGSDLGMHPLAEDHLADTGVDVEIWTWIDEPRKENSTELEVDTLWNNGTTWLWKDEYGIPHDVLWDWDDEEGVAKWRWFDENRLGWEIVLDDRQWAAAARRGRWLDGDGQELNLAAFDNWKWLEYTDIDGTQRELWLDEARAKIDDRGVWRKVYANEDARKVIGVEDFLPADDRRLVTEAGLWFLAIKDGDKWVDHRTIFRNE